MRCVFVLTFGVAGGDRGGTNWVGYAARVRVRGTIWVGYAARAAVDKWTTDNYVETLTVCCFYR